MFDQLQRYSTFSSAKFKRVALICGTADRGTAEPAEPAEPREITSFFVVVVVVVVVVSFATYIPGIRLQLISLLCIDPDFLLLIRQYDSTVMIRPRGYQAHR